MAKQKGRVAMAKVDIDDHTDLAIEYGVRPARQHTRPRPPTLLTPLRPQVSAVPTVIAMRGGDVVDRFVGIKDDDQLDSFVSKVIGQ